MSGGHAEGQPPALDITVSIEAELLDYYGPDGMYGGRVAEAIKVAADDILRRFGIPARAAVRIGVLAAEAAQAQPLMTVSAGTRRCSYPEDLLTQARAYLLATHPDPDGGSVVDWLRGLADGQTDEQSRTSAEFFALTVGAILQLRPDLLFGEAQWETYLREFAVPPDSAWLRSALAAVLRLGISLADRDTVARILADAHADGLPAADGAERLVAALRPPVIQLCAPRTYLRELTIAIGTKSEAFVRLRHELEASLGVRYPALRLVADDRLRQQSFAVRVNHCRDLPVLGLRPGQFMVNAPLSELRTAAPDLWEETAPIGLADPAGGRRPHSVVPAQAITRLQELGYTLWDPWEFIAASLGRVLRRRGAATLSIEEVDLRLAEEQPALAAAVRSRFSVPPLTRLLRALAADQVAIGDQRRILERLLDFDLRRAVDTRDVILDHRPVLDVRATEPADDFAALLSFLRGGLRRQISAQYSRGSGTLVVYLLGQELEERMQEYSGDAGGFELVFAAILRELRKLPTVEFLPQILTSAGVRGPLADLLAPRFPDLVTLAYEDLTPELNVQPIARISL
jgi:FHIPEP family